MSESSATTLVGGFGDYMKIDALSKGQKDCEMTKQISIATDLDDLLTRDDQDFLVSTYRVLLSRLPDEVGFDYYMNRIRKGISKGQIIYEIATSKEAKSVNSSLIGLREHVVKYRRANYFVFGIFYRKFKKIDDHSFVCHMNLLANRLARVRESNDIKFNEIIKLLDEIRGLVASFNNGFDGFKNENLDKRFIDVIEMNEIVKNAKY